MKAKKVSKGYRLKPETHKMIKQIQKYVRGSVDDSVNMACRRFLKDLKNPVAKNKNTIWNSIK
jgi:hypothetical protein